MAKLDCVLSYDTFYHKAIVSANLDVCSLGYREETSSFGVQRDEKRQRAAMLTEYHHRPH